jgi:hypothetical protein
MMIALGILIGTLYNQDIISGTVAVVIIGCYVLLP